MVKIICLGNAFIVYFKIKKLSFISSTFVKKCIPVSLFLI